ncbi:MAG: extracellular solute-binding protein [Chloroflexi bacterium]|nr:extracellular solute-binding protein [Chloroflexota bacterium]
MIRCRLLLLVPVLAALVWTGCARSVEPTPSAPEKAVPAKSVPKPDWEVRWENTLAKARSEGIIRVYTIWRPETRTTLTQAFKEKYGIEVEFTPFSRGPELIAKFQAEKRAGLNLVDVFGVGGTTLIASMKPEGLLAPVEPLLILPEVTNAKLWRGGELPIKDKGGYAVSMLAGLQRYITYNSDLIREGEITTYKDLLKPQYKGKIAINDPSVPGQGNAWFGHLARDLWNVEEASEFLRQLIVQQEAVVQRDNRLHAEWVARGKYPVGLATLFDNLAEFIKLGAPLKMVVVKEGDKILSGAGAIGVPPVSAHPAATALFVNWILTKEGQTNLAIKGFGIPSLRADVSTESINPIFIPGPQEKIFYDSEEDILFRGKMQEVARKIIQEASK